MTSEELEETSEYAGLTEFDWVRYDLETCLYDYKVHHIAADRIRGLIDRLERVYGKGT